MANPSKNSLLNLCKLHNKLTRTHYTGVVSAGLDLHEHGASAYPEYALAEVVGALSAKVSSPTIEESVSLGTD
ncbi:MAG TPA: hypothetical protein VF458_19350 [Ktedonobacteraceae bacterium]